MIDIIGTYGKIDSSVRDSFLRAPDGGFIARNNDYSTANPALNIASIARGRLVDGASLDLPEGCSQQDLSDVVWETAYPGKDVPVSDERAKGLALIGARILELNVEGKVRPPLDPYEGRSIAYLVECFGF